MHIAIYSYKVADRKQMERLMEREADKWIREGDPIYVYTFGSVESLMASTLNYDAVLIDLCDIDTVSAEDIINIYREKRIRTYVIECAKLRTLPEEVEGGFFLQKDITVLDLHNMMIKVSEIKKSDAAKIELRTERDTIYVEEPEIIYILQKGHQVEAHLTGDRIVNIYGHAETLYYEIEPNNPTFVIASLNTVINVRHIEKISLNKATMCDGKVVKMNLRASSFAKKALTVLKSGSTDIMEQIKNLN